MEKVKLYELIEKPLSGVWGEEDVDGSGIPVLRTTNFTNNGVLSYLDVVTRKIVSNNLKDKYLRVGDILIEKSGGSDKQPVGRVVYFEGEENKYLFNNFTSILRVKNSTICFPKYLFYALFSNYQQGGTRPYENKTTGLHNLKLEQYINSFEIPLPSLEEQKAIAERLDKVSELIEKRKQQLEKLDLLIKSRFIEMFGDIKDDEKVALSNICLIITDGTHQPPKFTTMGIPFLFVSNIVGNTITYDAEKFISEETYAELIKRTPIEIGDVLLSTVGSYGHPAVVKSDKPFCFQRHIAYLKPNKKLIDSEYFHGAILSVDVQKQIEERVKGIAQKTLNLSEIRKIKLPLPTMDRQKQFAVFVEQVDKSKFEIQKSLEKLEILKKSLMQKYFG